MAPNLPQKPLRGAIVASMRAMFRSLCRVEIYGEENIPNSGPYLVVFNHVSIYDPVAVVSLLAIRPEVFGAAYLWGKFGIGALMRHYGAIPVQRGKFNRRALSLAQEIISEKGTLMLAPEGTRSGEPGMKKAKPGVAYIAGKMKCPVIPVSVEGTTQDLFAKALKLKRPKIILRVGQAHRVHLAHKFGKKRSAELQRETDKIMVKIAQLLPENYWGYYANFLSKKTK